MLRKNIIPVVPEPIKEKIYALFNNDDFLEEVTFITRDFLMATWLLESEPYIIQLREKKLLTPINKLIQKSFHSDLKLNIQSIAPITKTIFSQFLNTNNCNKLYESIIYKWWSESSCFVNKPGIVSYSSRMIENINHAVHLLSGLTSIQKNELAETISIKQFDALHNITNLFPPRRQMIVSRKMLLQVLMPITIVVALYNNFSAGMLAIAVLTSVIFSAAMYSYYSSKTSRKYSIERSILTDYLISDIILKTIDNLLDIQSNPPKKIQDKNKYHSKNALSITTYPHNAEMNVNPYDTHTEYRPLNTRINKVKQDLRQKNKDNKRAIMEQFVVCPNKITWQGMSAQVAYVYKPLKIRSIVIELWSDNPYLKIFSKNNFILCESSTLKSIIPNKVIRSEFKSILRSGAVVQTINHRGLVRVGDSLKAKTLKTGLSHYRLFCEAKLHTTIMENGKNVTKTLHAPVAFRNK